MPIRIAKTKNKKKFRQNLSWNGNFVIPNVILKLATETCTHSKEFLHTHPFAYVKNIRNGVYVKNRKYSAFMNQNVFITFIHSLLFFFFRNKFSWDFQKWILKRIVALIKLNVNGIVAFVSAVCVFIFYLFFCIVKVRMTLWFLVHGSNLKCIFSLSCHTHTERERRIWKGGKIWNLDQVERILTFN